MAKTEITRESPEVTFVTKAAAVHRSEKHRVYSVLGTTDEDMKEMIGKANRIADDIARCPAASPAEVLEKLRILCDNLRNDLDTGYSGPVADYLLAESARSDLEAWLLREGADRAILGVNDLPDEPQKTVKLAGSATSSLMSRLLAEPPHEDDPAADTLRAIAACKTVGDAAGDTRPNNPLFEPLAEAETMLLDAILEAPTTDGRVVAWKMCQLVDLLETSEPEGDWFISTAKHVIRDLSAIVEAAERAGKGRAAA